jgi:hypothetical protein
LLLTGSLERVTDSGREIALSSVGLFIPKVKLVTISAFVRVNFVIHCICYFLVEGADAISRSGRNFIPLKGIIH